jgi:hypothetical protein
LVVTRGAVVGISLGPSLGHRRWEALRSRDDDPLGGEVDGALERDHTIGEPATLHRLGAQGVGELGRPVDDATLGVATVRRLGHDIPDGFPVVSALEQRQRDRTVLPVDAQGAVEEDPGTSVVSGRRAEEQREAEESGSGRHQGAVKGLDIGCSWCAGCEGRSLATVGAVLKGSSGW